MKKINLVNLEMEIDQESIDADDYGHRLVQCMSEVVDSSNVVNLIKVKIGKNINANQLSRNMKFIRDDLKEMGANNCVFVPIIRGYIEDISVEYIEVKHESDNRTD